MLFLQMKMGNHKLYFLNNAILSLILEHPFDDVRIYTHLHNGSQGSLFSIYQPNDKIILYI